MTAMQGTLAMEAVAMDSLAVLISAAMAIAAMGASLSQSAPVFSASQHRFHSRLSGETPLMARSYSEELEGKTLPALGKPRRLIPLRLDYHNRQGSHSPDERRIVLCAFWPDIEPQFPDFPFAKVCR